MDHEVKSMKRKLSSNVIDDDIFSKKGCLMTREVKIVEVSTTEIGLITKILLSKIFTYLDVDTMYNRIRFTCRYWRNLFCDKESWSSMMINDYNMSMIKSTIMPDFSLVQYLVIIERVSNLGLGQVDSFNLGKFPRLKRLTIISDLPCCTANIINVMNLQNIVDLSITQQKIRLPILPKLTSLSLHNSIVEEIHFTKEIRHLKILNCKLDNISSNLTSTFQEHHGKLKTLEIDTRFFKSKFNFSNLEKLGLWGSQYDLYDPMFILPMIKLTTMFIGISQYDRNVLSRLNIDQISIKLTTLIIGINQNNHNILSRFNIDQIKYLKVDIFTDEFKMPTMNQLIELKLYCWCSDTVILEGIYPMLKKLYIHGNVQYSSFSAPNLASLSLDCKDNDGWIGAIHKSKLNNLVYMNFDAGGLHKLLKYNILSRYNYDHINDQLNNYNGIQKILVVDSIDDGIISNAKNCHVKIYSYTEFIFKDTGYPTDQSSFNCFDTVA